MSRTNNVTLKVSGALLEAFARQCHHELNNYEVETDHDQLLVIHLEELYELIVSKLRLSQNTYTLKLQRSAALAFMQVWQNVDITHDPYSKVFIDSAIWQIDKNSKSPIVKYQNGN